MSPPRRSSRIPGGSSTRSSPPTPSPPTPDTSDLSSGDSGSDFEETLRPRGKRGPPRAPIPKRPRRKEPSGEGSSTPESNTPFEATKSGKIPKRPHKELSTEGSSTPESNTPFEATKSGKRKEPSGEGSSTPEPNTLFEAIKSGKVAVEVVVDEWLDTYKQDRESGFLELANFIIRSCGCRGVVTQKMFQELQNSEIIRQLTEKFEEDSPEYPLALTSRPWRRFRAGFCELLGVLVQRCRFSILYDEFLMDSLVSLLIGLSDSQVRAFRHTSTLAALKVMTALVEVGLGLGLQQQNQERQLQAERSKGPSRWAAGKLENLLEKQRELREQQEEMENMMNVIFKGVFVHRYRDVVPEIRAICMEELGTWMRRSAASFLTDSYLKYLGWTLHDKQREVRLQCVKALQGLYGHPATAAHMELFTSRFKPRMVAMVLDKEPEVAVEAVKLLTLILENMEEALTEEDCHSIYPVVFVSNRALAAAAGLFLYRKLLNPRGGDPEPPSPGATKRFFRLLLNFFLESELHEHAVYLVDSLWDCAGSQLRDWDTITSLLLEKSPQEALADGQEKALVEILAASVAQAAVGQPPVGRGPAKKPSSRQRKAQEEERTRLSHCLIPALPHLLAKFSADAEKAAPLLEVLQGLELGVYCTGRMEKHLELVLEQVQEVVLKHTEPLVLEAASRALHALCHPELALSGRGDLVRSRLADHLADKCHQDVTDLLQSPPLDEEDIYSMAATLRRISFLFNAHDLTPWGLFQPCSQLLQHAVDVGEVPPQVIVPTLSCLHFHLLWELSSLPGTNVPQVQLRELKGRIGSFCSLCQSCLSDGDPGVQQQAFIVLSDLLLVLGPGLPRGGRGALSPLMFPPDPELQSQLAAFLMDHVFHPSCTSPQELSATEDSESHLQDLHRRRLLLAAFCKLLIYNVLELSAASDVFKHYSKFYRDFGDIIKETLSCTRQLDRQGWAQTLLLSLQQLMSELLLEQGPQIRGAETFLEIRDLARKFSLLFSLHPTRNRPELLGIHRAGISFAFRDPPGAGMGSQPLNIPFLEVLSEFSPRLLRPDKALILSHLEQTWKEHQGGSPPPQSGDRAWPSLVTYRRSLQPQEEEGGGSGAAPPPKTPRAAKRPRRDASSEPPTPSLSSPPPTPALTSTLLRGGPRAPPPRTPRTFRARRRNLGSDPNLYSSLSHQHRMSRLSMMVVEEEEEEEEEASEQQRDRIRDLFDSSILGIEGV